MRHLLVLFAGFALVLSTAVGTVQADTSGGCSGATQCRFVGLGVDASWSSVPTDGPVLGAVYTETYVAASTSMTTVKGTKTRAGGLWFEQFTYRFDGSDKPTPISDSYVSDFGTDLVVSVDAKLKTAAVSGTVMVVSCSIDADFNETCGDPVATAVRGTWTATSPALKVTSTYKAKGPGLMISESFQGTQRDATASVAIGGRAVPGVVGYATISNSSGHSVSICRLPAC
jgi:hypothetical protein